ncbi:MAG: ExeA family protein [Syntrophales bacterium]
MYTRFYGLKERPFEISPDPRFLFLGENHKEALAHLIYAVKAGKSFTVITGEVGTGKTILVQTLLSRLDGEARTAHIFNPKLNPSDFLHYICTDLGLMMDGTRSKGQMLASLHHFLLDCYARNEKVILIIDEAQALDPRLLEEVRLLTNLETSKSKLLQVILLGQPELDNILADPNYRQLKQRVSIRFRIKPLNFKETADYTINRLKTAGAADPDIFDSGALKEIYRYSGGIPRLINIVCDNALLTGYASETRKIGRRIIREVIDHMEGAGRQDWKRPAIYILLISLLVFLVFWLLIYLGI